MVKMRLNELLFNANMNQKDLAERLNIPKNTVGKYCNNTFTMINKEHIDSICNFFQCDIGELIECTYSEPNNPNQLKMVFNKDGNTTYDAETDKEYIVNSFKRNTKPISINKQFFYDYMFMKLGKLTQEDILKYALLLCEADNTIGYKETVTMITNLNNQYKNNGNID